MRETHSPSRCPAACAGRPLAVGRLLGLARLVAFASARGAARRGALLPVVRSSQRCSQCRWRCPSAV